MGERGKKRKGEKYKRWIPDFSGMTYGDAGMTYGDAGMTYGGEGKIKMWDGNAVMSNE